MKVPEFIPGDWVGHFREPGNVGKVVSIEKRGIWPCRRWVYWVRWRAGYGPVPLAHGLWPVPPSAARMTSHREAV
jgi:uncharacterized protein (DUF111 family)